MSTTQVAIVTGCADEICCATARRLIKAGISVVACYTGENGLAELERDLNGSSNSCLAVKANFSQASEIDAVVDTTLSAFGRIDVLVNGLALDYDLSAIGGACGRVVGPWPHALLVNAVIPHMSEAGGGRIVNVVPSSGKYRSAYFRYHGKDETSVPDATAAGAVLAFTRQLAFELAPQRVRVNAVVVGWIRTPSAEADWNSLAARDRKLVLDEISLGRLGTPDEVAAVIHFLTSDASSYVTGTSIDVNGGLWMS